MNCFYKYSSCLSACRIVRIPDRRISQCRSFISEDNHRMYPHSQQDMFQQTTSTYYSPTPWEGASRFTMAKNKQNAALLSNKRGNHVEGRRGYILPASMAAANYSNYVMYYGYLHYMLEALMSVRKERMTKERIRGGSFMKICGGYPCQSVSN